MVITRVTYYKCKAPPRTYHYVTLRDKVHLAHLWLGTSLAHLWGYSPYLNVFCVGACDSLQHRPGPNYFVEKTQDGSDLQQNTSRKDIFALFFWTRPRPAPIDH